MRGGARLYTMQELLDGYRAKTFSPVEIAKTLIEKAKTHHDLNAFITITEEIALKQAEIAEKKWQLGEAGALEGIPISYKDNIHTKGITTTSGSKVDENFIPDNNADVVRALNQAGAVMIGKNNLDEYAFGITNDNPFYGAAKNPWQTDFMSGGSSGGSAVAVAAGLSVAAMGSDTGGSIRIPAASCGLVGLKPTYGLLSGKGITPVAWSLDTPSPI